MPRERISILASKDAKIRDGVDLWFGDGANGPRGDVGDAGFQWDGTNLILAAAADDTLWEIGDSATTQLSFDLKWYGGDASGASYLYFDASANLIYTTGVDLQFKDADYLVFGTGAGAAGDVSVVWDGTNLIITAVADDTLIEVGDSAATQKSFDLKWYGQQNNGASYLYFDASADLIYSTGVDLQFKDSDYLVFGTGAGAAGDVNVVWDGTNLIINAVADDTLIEIGDSAATQLSFDLKWYGNASSGAEFLYFDASASLIYTTGVDVQLKDADLLVFGTGAGATGDVNITWDGTNLIVAAVVDDTLIELGDSAATQLSFDLKWYANEASGASFLYFDASANLVYTTGVDLQFLDNDYLVFGAGAGASGDVNITWDGTNLIVTAVADDTLIEIGDASGAQKSFDLKWYGEANAGADFLYFDASANLVYTTNIDIQFKDADLLVFGTGAGAAGDVQVRWDGTDLDVLATADDSVINFGDGTASFDVKVFGNTANDYVLWDASEGQLILADADTLFFGTGVDAGLRWSTGDADNHSLVLALGDSNQSLHVTDKGAIATDWNVAARTDPSVFIHSNTTPATDYLDIGNHDGTNAWLNMVGGTGLDIAFEGIRALRLDDGAISGFAGAADTAGKSTFIAAPNGGAASADTSGVAGGALTFVAGDGSAGGAHTANNPNGGNGADITFTPGAGGAAGGGGTGVVGDPGKFALTRGRMHIARPQVIDMADAAVTLTVNPGTPVGTTLTSNLLAVDANSGATENLLLPPEADCDGLWLLIVNTGGESIVLQDDAGGNPTPATTIATGEIAFAFCDGTTWYAGNAA